MEILNVSVHPNFQQAIRMYTVGVLERVQVDLRWISFSRFFVQVKPATYRLIVRLLAVEGVLCVRKMELNSNAFVRQEVMGMHSSSAYRVSPILITIARVLEYTVAILELCFREKWICI